MDHLHRAISNSDTKWKYLETEDIQRAEENQIVLQCMGRMGHITRFTKEAVYFTQHPASSGCCTKSVLMISKNKFSDTFVFLPLHKFILHSLNGTYPIFFQFKKF